MDKKEITQNKSNNISTEDILNSLESFGNRTKSQEPDRAKASNRDSGVSESCLSYASDPLSATSDGQAILSDSERLSFASDTFSVVSDPLGVCGSSDGEGDNDIHYFITEPWDERQSLEKDWNCLFSSKTFLPELTNHALAGNFKSCKYYRSIAWKLFLECLPEDQSEWITKTNQLRHEYELFKQKSLINPSISKDNNESLHILHPLSLEETSPWKKYFEDNELKTVINQDLDRLYPEMEFFHSSEIKEMMLNLLFCYVKKNESLGYKQGMHELLAPIVYVLEHDSKAHRYMEGDGFWEISRCLMDPAFIEHDAFSMFCQLMEVTEAWYQQQQPVEISSNNKFVGQLVEPFTDPLISPPTAIVKKLNKIQDHLLRKHDPDLWIHMKELNIVPQVYGLRWIRLLFSREFLFHDVLVIWDALFAEGSHLDLVDYIYIVMLQTIRNKLMAGNYTTCMGHLMKFPRVYKDVNVYVKRALNLRGAKKSRPLSRESTRPSSPRTSTPVISSQGKNTERFGPTTGKETTPKKGSQRRPHTTLSAFTKRYTPFMDPTKHRALTRKGDQLDKTLDSQPTTTELVHKSPRTTQTDILSPVLRERTDSTSSVGSNSGRTMKSLGSDLKTKFSRPRSRSRQSVEELEKDHQRLQIQVSHLNTDLERTQSLYLYCGRKLDSYIGLIQEEITKDDEADRDVIYLSLAGLKQVRDLLKGTLSYRGSSMETEKDFVDIDKGIANRLQITSPNVHPATTSTDDLPVPFHANFSHYENTPGTLFSINPSTEAVLKTENINGASVNLNDEQTNQKCGKIVKENAEVLAGGTLEDEKQDQGDSSLRPEECCANPSDNNRSNGTQENAGKDDSNKTILEAAKDNHFKDEKGSEIQKVATPPLQEIKQLQNSTVLSLDSYLKNHGGEFEYKEPIKISGVPCATGAELTSSENTLDPLQAVSDVPLLVDENHGYTDVKHDNIANNRSKENRNILLKFKQKNDLKVGKSTPDNVLSCHSDASSPDEPLEGFVFVNKDGTARSNQGSPARLSPTHPLDTVSGGDEFDGSFI